MGVANSPLRLVDRRPALRAEELLARFRPPPRFSSARFETYKPNPEHPSQADVRAQMEAFSTTVGWRGVPSRWWRRPPVDDRGRPGRYLDGGFGVGKTHLLAALWHAVQPAPAAYLSFGELTAVVGFLGMAPAVEQFSRFDLLCIDEFELDDVANTLLAVTFLRGVIGDGRRVVTTSNSLPQRLGEGRFNADDFQREIAAIAGHFESLRLDGPDYRGRSGELARPLRREQVTARATTWERPRALDHFDQLLVHLRSLHPVQFSALLDGLDAVFIEGMRPIENQGDALLFVAFVDELYDAEIVAALSGCQVDELFPSEYRHGGYSKKYGRCESRLSSLLLNEGRRGAGPSPGG